MAIPRRIRNIDEAIRLARDYEDYSSSEQKEISRLLEREARYFTNAERQELAKTIEREIGFFDSLIPWGETKRMRNLVDDLQRQTNLDVSTKKEREIERAEEREEEDRERIEDIREEQFEDISDYKDERRDASDEYLDQLDDTRDRYEGYRDQFEEARQTSTDRFEKDFEETLSNINNQRRINEEILTEARENFLSPSQAEAQYQTNLQALEARDKQRALMSGGGLGKREGSGRAEIAREVAGQNYNVDRVREQNERQRTLQDARRYNLGQNRSIDNQENYARGKRTSGLETADRLALERNYNLESVLNQIDGLTHQEKQGLANDIIALNAQKQQALSQSLGQQGTAQAQKQSGQRHYMSMVEQLKKDYPDVAQMLENKITNNQWGIGKTVVGGAIGAGGLATGNPALASLGGSIALSGVGQLTQPDKTQPAKVVDSGLNQQLQQLDYEKIYDETKRLGTDIKNYVSDIRQGDALNPIATGNTIKGRSELSKDIFDDFLDNKKFIGVNTITA